jgi:PKD repeat protein
MKAPVTINLTDTSTSISCGITSWFWVARKDNPTTGTVVWTDNVQTPGPHSFIVAGSYYVSLTVTNAAGSNTTGSAEIKVKS